MEGFVFSGATHDQPRTTPPPEPPDGGSDRVNKISFRDKLIGREESLPKKEFVNLIEKKLFNNVHEKGDRLRPKCFYW